MDLLERESFLEQLDALLGEAAWRGGRLVLVRGEAGIGKTSLLRAFTSGRDGRVLWGTCDPVSPPRPLAPIVDIAQQVAGDLRVALADQDRHRVFSAFLDVLRAEGAPWVAVLEDLQWADDATLELLKIVGRRVAQMPAVVLVTFRDEEVGPEHPLSATLGDIPASSTVSIQLPPLSVAAVEELAMGAGVHPVVLHAVAGGNPFFVTEVLASGGTDVPATVRDAVLARARRLTPDALGVLHAAAVLGYHCDGDILKAVAVAQLKDIDECVAQGMLRRDGTQLAFRHELSQRALLASMTPAERANMHGRALAVLREREPVVEVAELAHHASAAGDAAAVLEYAPLAGARASALGAHRAARAHYENASRFLARLPVAERATLLERHAYECYLTEELQRAMASQEAAVSCWREVGEVSAEGRCLSELALYMTWIGESEGARVVATTAVELLESLAADSNLARAYARLAQLWMATGYNLVAIEWGEKAATLAERLGDEAVVVHALNTIGSAESCMGVGGGLEKLEESLQRALAANLEDDIARAFNNLIALSREIRRYEVLDRYAAEAVEFATERDLDLSRRCLVGDVAEAAMDRGRWDEAAEHAQATVDGGWRSGRLQSLWVLGRVAARRGDSEAFVWLDQALDFADSGMEEAGYLSTLRAARAEAAWLAGDLARARSEVEEGLTHVREDTSPWETGDLAFWARKIDQSADVPQGVAEPYALYLAGHPDKAAAGWAAMGCPYEEALALADCEDEASVRRSLKIFQSLGASPAAAIVTERLRAMGARRISRGPRATTRANPAGLKRFV